MLLPSLITLITNMYLPYNKFSPLSKKSLLGSETFDKIFTQSHKWRVIDVVNIAKWSNWHTFDVPVLTLHASQKPCQGQSTPPVPSPALFYNQLKLTRIKMVVNKNYLPVFNDWEMHSFWNIITIPAMQYWLMWGVMITVVDIKTPH